MKIRKDEEKPDVVPSKASRTGDIRWNWIERTIWTKPMLKALVNGVQGGKWYSLMDKVFNLTTLERAFLKVKANRGSAGIDGITIAKFEKRKTRYLERLHEELKCGSYKAKAIKRKRIPKPGSTETRPLGIPTVRDRVVQTALKMVLEPIFERDFSDNSHGFRPNRGCKDALRATQKNLMEGKRWVVDADLRKYFDTIPKERLMQRVKTRIADKRVLNLIESYLNQSVVEDMESWVPEAGTPQGAIISPLLANIYLNPLDHLMEQKGMRIVRYADDLVVMCEREDEARQALETLEEWTEQEGLSLHPEKTCVVDMNQPGGSFDFLGYHFEVSKRKPGKINRWPSRKSQKSLREKIRPLTKRCNGWSEAEIVEKVNPILKGWFEYFKHSKSSEFPNVDGWVRMRLRSILRKRHKGKGKGRGDDHHRWPNAYFSNLGLFSMEKAHRALLIQSSRR